MGAKNTYNPDVLTPGMTDAYHYATPQVYGEEGRLQNESVFYMFGRKEAFDGGYTVVCGLEDLIDIIDIWKENGFTRDTIALLRNKRTSNGVQKYSEDFLNLLSEEILSGKYPEKIEFNMQIDAVPEGSVVLPHEPLLRIKGPMMQAKLLESIALGIVNGQSAYATRAARIVDAVTQDVGNGSPTNCKVSVQGLRRGPGPGAAIESTGALVKGGMHSTSTGAGAMEYGMPFVGTMDHQFVMAHRNEIGPVTLEDLFELRDVDPVDVREWRANDAFRSFAMQYPDSGIFLVDTYDPEVGLENAITVIRELRELAKQPDKENYGKNYGVRFDSGDITALSRKALRRFAEEGWVAIPPEELEGITLNEKGIPVSDDDLLKFSKYCNVIVAASDGIDEHSALEMRKNGAYITSWGIGTAGSHPDPLGLVYKMSALDMEDRGNRQSPRDAKLTPRMKVASNAPVKSSNPGIINSKRYYRQREDGTQELDYIVVFDEMQGLDENREVVNLRDYSDRRTRPLEDEGNDILVPVYDRDGHKVFQPEAVYLKPDETGTRPLKIKNGYGKYVTDVTLVARHVKEELSKLPEAARNIVRPGSNEAQVEHVPVYLDANLFRLRQQLEAQHTRKVNSTGMGGYHERFEGGNKPAVPSSDITGELKAVSSAVERHI